MKKFATGFFVSMTIIVGLAGLGLVCYFMCDVCARGAEAIGLPYIAGALFGLALYLSALIGVCFMGNEDGHG